MVVVSLEKHRLTLPTKSSQISDWLSASVADLNQLIGKPTELAQAVLTEATRHDVVAAIVHCLEYVFRDDVQQQLLGELKPFLPNLSDKARQEYRHAFSVRLVEAALTKAADDIPKQLSRAMTAEDIASLHSAVQGAHDILRALTDNALLAVPPSFTQCTYDDLIANSSNFDRIALAVQGTGGSVGAVHEAIDAPLRQIVDSIKLGEFFIDILESYPRVDAQKLESDTQRFGAKVANCIALRDASEQLQPLLERIGEAFQVPDFSQLSIDVYEQYRDNLAASREVKEAFDWIKGREVMVRSSAVFSEDGEHLGAGIYESYKLHKNATFQTFCTAITAVYESLDTDLAREYRARIGITQDEKMGILIQEFIDSPQEMGAGHVNTIRPGMPGVIDVVMQDRFIQNYSPDSGGAIHNGKALAIPLLRDGVQNRLVGHHDLETVPIALPLDYTLGASPVRAIQAEALSKVGLLLERYFGTPLQLEFVGPMADFRIYLVQARPLPSEWCRPHVVSFPSREDYIWRGESFGVIDKELTILSNDKENHERQGLLIIHSGNMASEHIGWLERVLPKSGAVWLLQASRDLRGHVETRCAERGLTVITGVIPQALGGPHERSVFLEQFTTAYGQNPWVETNRRGTQPAIIGPSDKLSRLRVVSTGLEARVYGVEET